MKYKVYQQNFLAAQQFFKCIDMIPEGFFAFIGDMIQCIRLSTEKAFFDPDKCSLFQRLQMTGQVPVGYLQEITKPCEIHMVVHHKNRHDAQPDAVVKGFIYTVNESQVSCLFIGLLFIVFIIHDAAVKYVAEAKANGPYEQPITRELGSQ